eukprot:Rmarinus@m.18478
MSSRAALRFISRCKHRLKINNKLPNGIRVPASKTTSELKWNEKQDREFIDNLRKYALSIFRPPDEGFAMIDKTTGGLMQSLSLKKSPAHVMDLTQSLGLINHVDNPVYLSSKNDVPTQFSTEEMEHTDALVGKLRENDFRLDGPPPSPRPESMSTPLAIDSADTTEVDDAISVSSDARHVRVYIADPSRVLPPGSPLHLSAKSRASTIYLPERRIPMLPAILGERVCSIVPSDMAPIPRALAFDLYFEEDGSLRHADVSTAEAPDVRRLTYDAVNTKFVFGDDGEATTLRNLHNIAEKYRNYRLSQGAQLFDINVEPSVVGYRHSTSSDSTDGGSVLKDVPRGADRASWSAVVELKRADDTPAQRIVSEMMIATGEGAARIAAQSKLPVPFRGQDTSHIDWERLSHYPDVVASHEMLSLLNRTIVSVNPTPHDLLGIPWYCQVTSPLRRYLDLIAHHQLRSLLDQQTRPLSEHEMATVISDVEDPLDRVRRLQRLSERYWKLEVIRQGGEGKLWSGYLLPRFSGRREDLTPVHLEEVGLRVMVPHSSSHRPGARVQATVTDVRPLQNILRVRI